MRVLFNGNMRKTVNKLIVLFFVLLIVGFNLGKWLDVTQKPVKSDLVVCLGGGTVDRVKKSLGLVNQEYAKHFLLLGESWYNQPYLQKHLPSVPVTVNETPKNTKEEVAFIKKFMLKNGYKSVLIVTDPPHSRRVSLLFALLKEEGDENLCFHLIGSDVDWWDPDVYYQDKHGRNAVIQESMKIIGSYLLY